MSSRPATTLKIVLTLSAFAAAFAAHQWWSSQHEATDRALAPPEDLLQDMRENVAELAKLAEQPDCAQAADTADRAHELIAGIDATSRSILDKAGDAKTDLVAEARMVQLHAYFFAAMRRPGQYREPLAELASQLERDLPDSTCAFQASALRFASQHDLARPLDEKGLRELRDQAGGYSRTSQGIALHSFVSHRLFSNGQTSSADAVLKAGLAQFRGQAGWHDLYYQRIDQGHLKAPLPKMAGGAFKPRAPNRCRADQGCPDSDSILAEIDKIRAEQAKLREEIPECKRQHHRNIMEDVTRQSRPL